jgi:hypothetical protein
MTYSICGAFFQANCHQNRVYQVHLRTPVFPQLYQLSTGLAGTYDHDPDSFCLFAQGTSLKMKIMDTALSFVQPKWQLTGYDTFDAKASYFIGRYYTRRRCLWAAWFYLWKLEHGSGAEVDGGPPPSGVRDTFSVSGPPDYYPHYFSPSAEVSEYLRELRKR